MFCKETPLILIFNFKLKKKKTNKAKLYVKSKHWINSTKVFASVLFASVDFEYLFYIKDDEEMLPEHERSIKNKNNKT